MQTKTLSLAEIEALAFDALTHVGASEKQARPIAVATAKTEADGVASHGLAYVPIYCEHVQCGKVDGQAEPIVERPAGSLVRVNAATGFAHAAIDAGFEALVPLAREQGIAGLSIYNSYNCGVLGVHTQTLAAKGLIALGFTNAPASIAPSGGSKPVVGTNPFSVAAPGSEGGVELLIDQSASVIAKSEIMKHAREGKSIPEGWGLDADGNATTDPEVALKGSMAPSGGYKGVGIGLTVELFAAALSGAVLGKDASPFSGTVGGPPMTGQFFIAVAPDLTSGGTFADRLTDLTGAIREQEGARLPGDGRGAARARAKTEGVAVNVATLEKIEAILKG
ncbi:MAG: Ldh family oxidoreductase [Pseudomonadota bacterium]